MFCVMVNIDVSVFQDLQLLSCPRCDLILWSPERGLGNSVEATSSTM